MLHKTNSYSSFQLQLHCSPPAIDAAATNLLGKEYLAWKLPNFYIPTTVQTWTSSSIRIGQNELVTVVFFTESTDSSETDLRSDFYNLLIYRIETSRQIKRKSCLQLGDFTISQDRETSSGTLRRSDLVQEPGLASAEELRSAFDRGVLNGVLPALWGYATAIQTGSQFRR